MTKIQGNITDSMDPMILLQKLSNVVEVETEWESMGLSYSDYLTQLTDEIDLKIEESSYDNSSDLELDYEEENKQMKVKYIHISYIFSSVTLKLNTLNY